MSIKNKTLRIGDLVEIKAGTHWNGSDISRTGFILGPGQYHKSYMVLFTETGKKEQFHSSFIRFISTAYGEKIRFVQKI